MHVLSTNLYIFCEIFDNLLYKFGTNHKVFNAHFATCKGARLMNQRFVAEQFPVSAARKAFLLHMCDHIMNTISFSLLLESYLDLQTAKTLSRVPSLQTPVNSITVT